MPPNPGIWKLSSGAPAPCPCRLRVGISVKLPLADEPGRSALRHPRIPIRTLAVAATEDGRRAPGRGAGVGKRMPPNLGCRKYRPAPRRHARAGCASAPRRSGRATTFRARRPSAWRTFPSAAAVAATDRGRLAPERAADSGLREALAMLLGCGDWLTEDLGCAESVP